MTNKLNIGCGQFKKESYVNVDWAPSSAADVLHDLNSIPYPFSDDRFDVIEGNHVLEHLNHPFKVMIELHRIAKHQATISIRVPHFSRGFTHAEHQHGFDVSFPWYFNPLFPGGYQGRRFDLVKMRMNWFGQHHLKRKVLRPVLFHVLRSLGWCISLLANCSPFFCSRIWCFLVGGFDEIHFELRANKLQS